MVFPWGADANDVAVGADDPHRELGRYLAEARWLGGAPATVQDVQQKVFGSVGDRAEAGTGK